MHPFVDMFWWLSRDRSPHRAVIAGEVFAVFTEHAVDNGVSGAFEPQRAIAFVNEAQPLHLSKRPVVVRLDFGSEALRLGESRREDGAQYPSRHAAGVKNHDRHPALEPVRKLDGEDARDRTDIVGG